MANFTNTYDKAAVDKPGRFGTDESLIKWKESDDIFKCITRGMKPDLKKIIQYNLKDL